MSLFRSVARIPAERGKLPLALTVLVQAVGFLALVTIVRDGRPDPTADPLRWEAMGAFTLFMSISTVAVLFTVIITMAFHAMAAPGMEERAWECRILALTLAAGVVLADLELLAFGMWKGTWSLFAPMAALPPLDWTLTYMVLRFLE